MTTDVINGVPRSLLERVVRKFSARPHWDSMNQGQAIAELRKWLATAQPTADGEREAFEEWAASVGYHTERDMFQREKYQSSLTWELWRVWQARAALSPAGGGVDMKDVHEALAAAHSAIVYQGESTSYEYALRRVSKALHEVARLNAKPKANSQEVE